MKKPKKYGFGRIELLSVCLLIVAVTSIVLLSQTSQTYQSIISRFVTAMSRGNTNLIASLESSRFKDWIESSTKAQADTKGEHGAVVTNNFYDLARQDNELGLFNAQFLDGATIRFSNYQFGLYIPPKGTVGRSETYDTKTNDYSTSTYLPSFTIDVVRNGNSWLVDNVGFYAVAT